MCSTPALSTSRASGESRERNAREGGKNSRMMLCVKWSRLRSFLSYPKGSYIIGKFSVMLTESTFASPGDSLSISSPATRNPKKIKLYDGVSHDIIISGDFKNRNPQAELCWESLPNAVCYRFGMAGFGVSKSIDIYRYGGSPKPSSR